jgi:two-component system chemotaxis response regulator CheB
VAIGASTGGPQALTALMERLSPHVDEVPVLIVLHMPADFTALLTSHIERVAKRPCITAGDGQMPQRGRIYLAPGQMHLVARQGETGIVLTHRRSRGGDHRRSAVDNLFATASTCWGPATLGIVLTGMGTDGLEGARRLVAGGGSIIAQDRQSSAVWGMPGAVAREGLASAVLPVEAIAQRVAGILGTRTGGRL